MKFFSRTFYDGPYRAAATIVVLAVTAGGYFLPAIGLVVPGLILLAVVLNFRRRSSFCSGVCPNGRALSATLTPVARGRKLPPWLVEPGIRRAICGMMLFCMVNMLVRFGDGTIARVGRIFWAFYILAVGISIVVGWSFKPRSWCAFCPVGTLQDTIRSVYDGSAKKEAAS